MSPMEMSMLLSARAGSHVTEFRGYKSSAWHGFLVEFYLTDMLENHYEGDARLYLTPKGEAFIDHVLSLPYPTITAPHWTMESPDE